MRSDFVWSRVRGVTVLSGLLVFVGCAGNTRTNVPTTNPPLTSSGPMAGTLATDSDTGASSIGDTTMDISTYRFTDAQIANIAMTANRLDSTSGADVVDRLSNEDARFFARKMTIEHGTMMDSLRAITTRLGTASGANEVSAALELKASEAEEGSGNRLDRSYMQNEVAMHQRVLRTLDDAMLPQVRDPSLREQLLQMRTAVAAHLQEAESILARLPAR